MSTSTATVIITPTTDLAALTGMRVRIAREVPGYGRSVHYGVFTDLWLSQMTDGVGGMLREEPHGSCRGGNTGFHLPFGSEVTPAPVDAPAVTVV